MKKERIIRSIFVAELVLLAPLAAMLFTDEINWSLADFIIIGVLLAGVGVAYQLVMTGLNNNTRQAVIGIVFAVTLILIWVELAVGIFGSLLAGS